MFSAFIYFLVGALAMRVLQFFLAIRPSYDIYKTAEATALNVLIEMYVEREMSIKIVKLAYAEKDEQEFYEVEKAIKQRYEVLFNNGIKKIKGSLPYKVKYDTLDEAVKIYLGNGEKNEQKR